MLTPSMDTEELLARLLESFIATSACERGFVLLQQPAGMFHPSVTLPPGNNDFTGSSSVVSKTFDENQRSRVQRCKPRCPAWPATEYRQWCYFGARLRAPAGRSKVLGVLYVDSRNPANRSPSSISSYYKHLRIMPRW